MGNASREPSDAAVQAAESVADLNPRQRQILAGIEGQGFVTVETLAARFGVTMQTIRRDIIRLESLGLLQRFHGGAGQRPAAARMDYAEKRNLAIDAKGRIARTVAAMIPDGAAVFLDVGTTLEAVAYALRERENLRVFTASVRTAAVLAGCRGISLFVTGGMVGGPDGSLVGDAATQTLSDIRPDFAVIGFSGFDDDGAPMDFDPQKVAIKRLMIARATAAILAGDSTKFARSATMRIAPLSALNALVSDALPPEALSRMLRDSGVAFRPAE